MAMNNPVAGLLDHFAACIKSKESEMSVIQQPHAFVLKLSQQQFYAHRPVGNVGKGNKHAATRRQDIFGFAQNSLRFKKMLKHVAIGHKVKLFPYGLAPVRLIQIHREYASTEFAGSLRSFRVNFNAHHAGAGRRKLPGEETGGAAAFQNAAVIPGFFNEKMVPAETIAICGDLIAAAFQGGVLHQRFRWMDEHNCNIALSIQPPASHITMEKAVRSLGCGETIQMPLSEPRVSIVILNWNSYQVTLDCLLSLRKMDYRNFEVVLVDNGSIDGSPVKLLENVPEIRLIRNPTNLGFAGGCNVGIRDALRRGTDYVLLLNNDTIVAPDCLSQLVRVAESDEKVGALSPKILFFDHPDRLNYAGGEHRRWRLFPKVFGLRQLDDGSYDKIREVSFLTGCAFLIKAKAVRQIGVLEEVYFHFYEDIEWSLRVLKAGYKDMYVPSAVVWHKEHYVTNKNQGNGFIEFYLARANMIFARKHVPLKLWPFKMPFFAAWMVYRTLVFSSRLDWQKVLSLYKGFWAGCFLRLPEEETKL